MARELTCDDVNAIHDGALDRLRVPPCSLLGFPVQMLSDASTVRSVQTDGVDLVAEREGTVFVGKVADFGDGSDSAAHGVDALEANNLWRLLGVLGELRLEVFQVVVLKNDPLSSRVTHADNHRGVVHRVREVDAAGQLRAQRRKSSIVRDIARRENKSRRLAVELRELLLEGQMHARVAGNVPGAAGAMTVAIESTAESTKNFDTSANGDDLQRTRETYCIVSRTTGLLPMPR